MKTYYLMKASMYLGGAFVLLIAIGFGSLYMVGQQHEQAAINFWGEQYQPEEGGNTKIDWGLIGNLVIPHGGPLISPEAAGVCADTPLPVVPLRMDRDGHGYVLCGIGPHSVATSFDVKDIQDVELRAAVEKAAKGSLDLPGGE